VKESGMIRDEKGRKHKIIRRHNLGLVLREIRNHNGISRQNISERTGLTKTAISELVDELLQQKIIIETGKGLASKRGGRRPTNLEINSHAVFSIGLDIRREKVTGVLLDLLGNIIANKSTPILATQKQAAILDLIFRIIDAIREQMPAESRLLGMGVGAPSPLDLHQGTILQQ